MQHVIAALQVVKTFAQAELNLNEKARCKFEEQYNKMTHIRAVLKQSTAGTFDPNYMQVLLVITSKVCYCMLPIPCISQLVG